MRESNEIIENIAMNEQVLGDFFRVVEGAFKHAATINPTRKCGNFTYFYPSDIPFSYGTQEFIRRNCNEAEIDAIYAVVVLGKEFSQGANESVESVLRKYWHMHDAYASLSFLRDEIGDRAMLDYLKEGKAQLAQIGIDI